MRPSPGRDKVIWNRIRQGDETALSELFLLSSEMLLGYGLSFHANRELVKDCIQDVFLSIWTRRSTLPPVSHLSFYLITALRRQMLKQLKVRHVNLDPTHLSVDLTSPSSEEQQIEAENTNQQKYLLLKNLGELPQRQREIIYLRFYQGFSHDDICLIMQIKKQAAWNLLSRAIKKLESLMKNTYQGIPVLFLLQLFC
ncbi:MAG: sigma-70 family RNA polymerase sigma factor [Bacteroidota bacterium]